MIIYFLLHVAVARTIPEQVRIAEFYNLCTIFLKITNATMLSLIDEQYSTRTPSRKKSPLIRHVHTVLQYSPLSVTERLL
jgi:hypothetical protein